jgi:hypothetical protein
MLFEFQTKITISFEFKKISKIFWVSKKNLQKTNCSEVGSLTNFLIFLTTMVIGQNYFVDVF